MALTSGTRIGSYEVIALLGSGGMGEVYRARDTRLNRDVAIKIVPELFAADADRVARFQREAQVLASLNHPNIAHIHGLEDAAGSKALVLELVDGPTLADLIAKGPIPIDEALPIAKQIAEALEAAHEHGIVHRDLKPANIKLTNDGTVKVLDFGLAKASQGSDSGLPASGLSLSPTLTSPALATHAGIILGTAAYMSPEQAKGKPVDKRSDVWAFGCVLYEMLTGKRAFEGEDVSDTMALILRGEPDWSAIPPNVSPVFATFLHRCLEKDRRRRIGDMAAALFVLDAPTLIAPSIGAVPDAAIRNRGRKERLLWAAGLLTAVAATAAGYSYFRPPALDEPVRRLSIALPAGAGVTHLALSPDGRRLAFTSAHGERRIQLWLRSLDSAEVQPLSGTFGARTPFWSPDGRFIGFFADGKLKIVPAAGGPPKELCDGAGLGGGGTWNRDGVVLFGIAFGQPIRRVNAAGGPCTDVITSAGAGRFPMFLLDGDHFVYVVGSEEPAKRGLYIASLSEPTGRQLLADFSSALVAPASSGQQSEHLLFLREGALMAQPINLETFQLTGEVFRVASGASTSSSNPQVAAGVSDNGLLVYLSNSPETSQLTWMDRTGRALRTVGPTAGQNRVLLSPNEQSVATVRGEAVWLRDLVRDVESPLAGRLFGGGAWSPDGRHIVAGRGGGTGNFTVKEIATGMEEELSIVQSTHGKSVSDWSRDGRILLYTEVDSKTQADIWVLTDPLSAASGRKPVPFLVTTSIESQAQISPDGRCLAYTSDESGEFAVYVKPFPVGPGKVRVSVAEGREPRWRRDGRELYYTAGLAGERRTMMAVPVQPSSTECRVDVATALFSFTASTFHPQGNVFQYAPASDGQRFLVNALVDEAEPTLNVITNWEKAVTKVGE